MKEIKMEITNQKKIDQQATKRYQAYAKYLKKGVRKDENV